MLSCLQIENVAVIQKAEVHFQPGLNVLTGETGAGKSILIDSINAILGNRTSKDLVRTGASKAAIRASFAQIPDVVLDKLEAAGYERSAELLLSREITAESGSAKVDKRGKEALAKLAEVLNKQNDIDVYIEGHTDSKPINTAQFKDNWDLSVIRATSVVRILTKVVR